LAFGNHHAIHHQAHGALIAVADSATKPGSKIPATDEMNRGWTRISKNRGVLNRIQSTFRSGCRFSLDHLDFIPLVSA
jgi:hypothetical protein